MEEINSGRRSVNPQQCWEDSFRLMSENQDDRLLDADILSTCWDEEEWEW
jgi:hypothetical protein